MGDEKERVDLTPAQQEAFLTILRATTALKLAARGLDPLQPLLLDREGRTILRNATAQEWAESRREDGPGREVVTADFGTCRVCPCIMDEGIGRLLWTPRLPDEP